MRDTKGRFKKQADEGFEIIFTIPPFKKIIYIFIIFTVLLPWMVIGSRFNILKRILNFIETIMTKPTESDSVETPKKNGLFY